MLVKVVNDNVYPYTEKFKGQLIHIPAKGSITMDFNEASYFLGTMPGNIQVDANGIQKPESYKMLRIEKIATEPVKHEEPKKWTCMACGKHLHTKAAYEAHVSSEHLDELIEEDAKEKIQTKRRGRPKKAVTDDSLGDRDSSEA